MHYLVLELVPGETLAERIARGPIPVEEALEIATKIADALEQAHEQGIVHRDLKPANVKITPDDDIKVVDFGLAKALAEQTADADSSMSSTITRDATRVGVILGTAAYMSPEQAKGKHVDKRSDIFSFGAVLYEILTGKRAFQGEDVSDTLAYVLTKAPDWEALPAKLHPRLREVLRRCLTKDLKKRRRDMGDVRQDLEELSGLASPKGAPKASSAALRVGLAFAAGALLAGVAAVSLRLPPAPTPAVRRLTVKLPVPVADPLIDGVAMSPRGESIVFPAFEPLFRVSASGGTPERIPISGLTDPVPVVGDVLPGGADALVASFTGSIQTFPVGVVSLETGAWTPLFEGGSFPRYVPTGHIVYETDRTLMAVPFDLDRRETTGLPVPVVRDLKRWKNGNKARFGISEDGSLLYVPADTGSEGTPIVWVDRDGTATPVSDHRGAFETPRLSPDGRRLAIGRQSGSIWILDLIRDTLTRATTEATSNLRPLWSPDGGRLFFIWDGVTPGVYQPFSISTGGSGEIQPLAERGVPTSISPDARVLVLHQRSERGDRDIAFLRLDGTRGPKVVLGTRFDEHSGMVSPTGAWLAYVSDESGRPEVYLRSFPDLRTRIPVSTKGGTEPVWARDGSELFYRNGFEMLSVSISDRPDAPVGKPVSLFVAPFAMDPIQANYDVAADGRFVMIGPERASSLHLVLGSFQELERLVPTDE